MKTKNRDDLINYLRVMADQGEESDDEDFVRLCHDILEIFTGEPIPTKEEQVELQERAMQQAEDTGELWRAFGRPAISHRLICLSREPDYAPDVYAVIQEQRETGERGYVVAVHVNQDTATSHADWADGSHRVQKTNLYFNQRRLRRTTWPPKPGVIVRERFDPQCNEFFYQVEDE